MQRHSHSLIVDGTPEEAWSVIHPPPPRVRADGRRVLEHGDICIEVLEPGDAAGQGLVRTVTFRVPKWLLTNGKARSFETIVEARPHEYVRYRAVGRPLWSLAEGSHRFEDLGDGRTRITFEETYQVFNPWLARLLEARVHAFISADNQRLIRSALDQGIPHLRARRARG
ncbi:MAG TPA: SRPBCC family protein [Acidimicrobiales bacterium]|jgi:hypothetical protein|nr:SRPBCC family protein [Acidimicrobiales bacterium]